LPKNQFTERLDRWLAAHRLVVHRGPNRCLWCIATRARARCPRCVTKWPEQGMLFDHRLRVSRTPNSMPVALLSRPYNDADSAPWFATFAAPIGVRMVFRPFPWERTYGGGTIHVEFWSPSYYEKHDAAELGRAWEADERRRWEQQSTPRSLAS
jgi:hypothetical protein